MNRALQIRLANRQLEASGVWAAHARMARAAAGLERKRARRSREAHRAEAVSVHEPMIASITAAATASVADSRVI